MKRKALTLAITLAIFASLLVRMQSAKSVSNTIVVPNNYLQIQEAINAANEVDTILIMRN